LDARVGQVGNLTLPQRHDGGEGKSTALRPPCRKPADQRRLQLVAPGGWAPPAVAVPWPRKRPSRLHDR